MTDRPETTIRRSARLGLALALTAGMALSPPPRMSWR